MNAKHTHGDWWIGAIEGPEFDRRPVFSRNDDGFDTKICDVHFTGNADETNANARLIAASPELLAIVEKYLDSADKPMGMSDLADIDAEARVIVAKAKGEA